MRKILVAVSLQALPVMTHALSADFILLPCLTLDQARQALRANEIDLAIAGIHFDESRMFDLLRYAQADPATDGIPFLCLKILDDRIAPTFLQSAEIASRALGARDFIDLSEWRARLGDDEAFRQLRDCIYKLLPQ